MLNLNNLPTDHDDVDNLRIETIRSEDISWVSLRGQADIATLRRVHEDLGLA